MRGIPSAFTLGGIRYTVKAVTPKQLARIAKGDCYGYFDPDKATLYVAKDGRKISSDIVKQSFWHEFAHALLFSMGHRDYSNEQVVDQMGHLLKQFLDTAEK
jgi:hypothetical protein